MPNLDPRQWRPLFDAIYEMNTARDHADFLSAVVTGMQRLIPSDFALIHVLDRRRNKIALRMTPANPYNPAEMAYYVAHPHEDPLVAYYETSGDTRARRHSDVIPLREWKKSAHFRNCRARLGLHRSLSLPVTVNRDTVAGLTFDRKHTDFSRRHCDLLDAFAPHFLLAWKRHPSPWTVEEAPGLPTRERLRKLGLTPREADVLFWMLEGKQNLEIAAILGRSLETVQEHVGNLVRKLDQENRHAATVFAMRVLQKA
jgi:DNA-binding CsgD family transcriptional regulator